MARAKVCMIPQCPNASCVRIADTENTTRKDLCMPHGITTVKHYGDKVEVIDTWNGALMEDFDND